MDIKDSLKRFRQEFKLNQRQIASALDIPYQSYQGYEYGRNIPSASIIVKLATFYNVSTDYLLGLTDNPSLKKTDDPASEKLTEIDKDLIKALVDSQKSLKIALAKLGVTSE